MSSPGDFPLSEAPRSARKGLLSISMVLFSFTFFTGTMFAGGKLGMAFNFVDMLWIAAIGNTLLALYAAALALIASRSGLNTVLMGRLCFGEAGSRLSDFLLGFAELGWYAWGTATVAIVLVKMLGLAEGSLDEATFAAWLRPRIVVAHGTLTPAAATAASAR